MIVIVGQAALPFTWRLLDPLSGLETVRTYQKET